MTALRTVLHIGADKTGTTAIQQAMAATRAQLADNGIWYPDLDGRPDHLALATDPTRHVQPAPDGIEAVVVSSEALWSLPSRRIEAVLDRLPGEEVLVVAYVRDPAAHAEAAFGQRLRLARSERELRALFALRSVPPVVNPIVTRSLRRLRQLSRWSAAVEDRSAPDPSGSRPMARLAVRPYQPEGTQDWDVVVDLCRTAGLERAIPLVADRPDPRPNRTPDLTAIHASVLVRAEAGSEARTRFLDAVAAGGRPGSEGPLLPAPLRRHLRRRANRELVRLHGLVGGLGALIDDAGAEPMVETEPATVARSLDSSRARALLVEVWPSFPSGAPRPGGAAGSDR